MEVSVQMLWRCECKCIDVKLDLGSNVDKDVDVV